MADSELIDSLYHRKFRVGISTDQVGVLGNPERLLEFIDSLELSKIAGLELVYWRLISRDFLKKNVDRIVGVHGQMGAELGGFGDDPIDFLKATTLNMLIRSTLPELDNIGQMLDQIGDDERDLWYYLVHQPEASAILGSSRWSTHQPQSKLVLVAENHVQRNALCQAIEAVTLMQVKDDRSLFVFDIVHFLREHGQGVSLDYWPAMLEQLEAQKQGVLVHVPIGSNRTDSLPFEEVTDVEWRKLAQVLSTLPHFPIVEFQHEKLLHNIYFDPTKNQKHRADFIRKLRILNQHGILNLGDL